MFKNENLSDISKKDEIEMTRAITLTDMTSYLKSFPNSSQQSKQNLVSSKETQLVQNASGFRVQGKMDVYSNWLETTIKPGQWSSVYHGYKYFSQKVENINTSTANLRFDTSIKQEIHLRKIAGKYCENQQYEQNKFILKCQNVKCDESLKINKNCNFFEFESIFQHLQDKYPWNQRRLKESQQKKFLSQIKDSIFQQINRNFDEYIKQNYDKISDNQTKLRKTKNNILQKFYQQKTLNQQKVNHLRNYSKQTQLNEIQIIKKQQQQELQNRQMVHQYQKQSQIILKSTLQKANNFPKSKMKGLLKDVRTNISQYLNQLRIKFIKQEQYKVIKLLKYSVRNKQSIQFHKLLLYQKVVTESNIGITVAQIKQIFCKINNENIQSIEKGFTSNNYQKNEIKQYYSLFKGEKRTLFLCLGHDQSINGAASMIPLQISTIKKWSNQKAIIRDKSKASFIFDFFQENEQEIIRQKPIEQMHLHQDQEIIWFQTGNLKFPNFILSDFQKSKRYLYWQAWHIKQYNDNDKSVSSNTSQIDNYCNNSKILDKNNLQQSNMAQSFSNQFINQQDNTEKYLGQINNLNKQSINLNYSDVKNQFNLSPLNKQIKKQISMLYSKSIIKQYQSSYSSKWIRQSVFAQENNTQIILDNYSQDTLDHNKQIKKYKPNNIYQNKIQNKFNIDRVQKQSKNRKDTNHDVFYTVKGQPLVFQHSEQQQLKQDKKQYRKIYQKGFQNLSSKINNELHNIYNQNPKQVNQKLNQNNFIQKTIKKPSILNRFYATNKILDEF